MSLTVWAIPLVGLLGVALGAFGARAITGRQGPVTASAEADISATGPQQVRVSTATSGELDQLIRSVIEARDLADPSSVMAARLGAALTEAGVRELAPVGRPFDPARHFAVGTTPAPDQDKTDVIAEVQRVGYADGDHVIREADVVVFRQEPAT